MLQIPMQHILILAAILFLLGLAGLLTRRNLIFTLMSIEIMLNASGLAFVAAGSRWAQRIRTSRGDVKGNEKPASGLT